MKLSEMTIEQREIYRINKRESDRRYREKYRDKILEQKKQYYHDNKDRMSLHKKLKYKENPEPAKSRAKKWKLENRDRHNYLCMVRHARKLKAMPKWLTEFMLLGIKEFYSKARALKEITGINFEVDHIVPLQGNNVCGLHVPWNLQILTESENCSKNNSTLHEEYLISKEGYRWLTC